MDNPINWGPDETPITFYNPLEKAIDIESRNAENVIETETLLPMRTFTFPKWKADHIIKNIKDAYIAQNKINPLTGKDRITGLEKEIYGIES